MCLEVFYYPFLVIGSGVVRIHDWAVSCCCVPQSVSVITTPPPTEDVHPSSITLTEGQQNSLDTHSVSHMSGGTGIQNASVSCLRPPHNQLQNQADRIRERNESFFACSRSPQFVLYRELASYWARDAYSSMFCLQRQHMYTLKRALVFLIRYTTSAVVAFRDEATEQHHPASTFYRLAVLPWALNAKQLEIAIRYLVVYSMLPDFNLPSCPFGHKNRFRSMHIKIDPKIWGVNRRIPLVECDHHWMEDGCSLQCILNRVRNTITNSNIFMPLVFVHVIDKRRPFARQRRRKCQKQEYRQQQKHNAFHRQEIIQFGNMVHPASRYAVGRWWESMQKTPLQLWPNILDSRLSIDMTLPETFIVCATCLEDGLEKEIELPSSCTFARFCVICSEQHFCSSLQHLLSQMVFHVPGQALYCKDLAHEFSMKIGCFDEREFYYLKAMAFYVWVFQHDYDDNVEHLQRLYTFKNRLPVLHLDERTTNTRIQMIQTRYNSMTWYHLYLVEDYIKTCHDQTHSVGDMSRKAGLDGSDYMTHAVDQEDDDEIVHMEYKAICFLKNILLTEL